MKHLTLAAVFVCAALPGWAETVAVASNHSVADTTQAFETAVKEAGARVFLTVDFEAGSKRMGKSLRPTRIVYFGGPMIGAAALQQSQEMARTLPLSVLVHRDSDGQVWVSYDDPVALGAGYGVAADDPGIMGMTQAYDRFIAASVN